MYICIYVYVYGVWPAPFQIVRRNFIGGAASEPCVRSRLINELYIYIYIYIYTANTTTTTTTINNSTITTTTTNNKHDKYMSFFCGPLFKIRGPHA